MLSARARVLIVGSMPGAASLAAGRYYAHPRNGFWPIVGAVCGFDPNADYERRTAALQRAGIALWDVLQQCRRRGSLDSAIEASDRAVNDFAALFLAQPDLHTVLCNGGTAHGLFVRLVLPTLPRAPVVHRLPSTSPAHAARTSGQKLAAWRTVLAPWIA